MIVWQYWKAQDYELHNFVSVASEMSNREYDQTAVSVSSQFLTKQKQIQV